jgi:hypothetical protein
MIAGTLGTTFDDIRVSFAMMPAVPGDAEDHRQTHIVNETAAASDEVAAWRIY